MKGVGAPRLQRGQVLPLFALMLVVICGFAALAIDVSSAYSTRRAMRSAADAAALAGAQNLQMATSRGVSDTEYARAKTDALKVLIERYGGIAGECPEGLTCFESGYRAKLVTPLSSSSSCESCDPKRSISVALERPGFALSFARVLGLGAVDIRLASIGTIGFARNYTVVTLRPPHTPKVDDNRAIWISGGSTLQVINGDVASNGNMNYDGVGSQLILDDGYDLDWYRRYPSVGPQWTGTPAGNEIASLVPDPKYWEKLGSPSGGGIASVIAGDSPDCVSAVDAIKASPTGNYVGTIAIPTTTTKITCYGEGHHPATVSVAKGELAVLLPGVHFFDDGLVVKGTLIGGYEAAKPGVTLVFKEAPKQFWLLTPAITGGKDLAEAVSLNAGTRDLKGGPEGTAATAALYSGKAMATDDLLDPKPLTLVVVPTGTCAVTLPLGGTCLSEEGSHSALDITGNAALYLGGVQYAPEDQVTISGHSGSQGYVGQLWAWTVRYHGGITVLQEGAESVRPGLLRLDAACTTAKTKCGT